VQQQQVQLVNTQLTQRLLHRRPAGKETHTSPTQTFATHGSMQPAGKLVGIWGTPGTQHRHQANTTSVMQS
jgi:hypothetical protein